jgi:hypothetical protein
MTQEKTSPDITTVEQRKCFLNSAVQRSIVCARRELSPSRSSQCMFNESLGTLESLDHVDFTYKPHKSIISGKQPCAPRKAEYQEGMCRTRRVHSTHDAVMGSSLFPFYSIKADRADCLHCCESYTALYSHLLMLRYKVFNNHSRQIDFTLLSECGLTSDSAT